MYNEDLKNRFIQEQISKYPWQSKTLEYIFNKSENDEKRIGKDICTMSGDELQTVLNNLLGLRSNSKESRMIILRNYSKWCIANGVENANDELINIKFIGIEKIKQQTIPNPLALQRYLDVIFEPENEELMDNVYRCYFWLAFAGMDEEDIFETKIEDIDFRNMKILYRKRDTLLDMYPESLPAFRNCVELTEFKYVNSSYKKPIYRDRIKCDLLLRGIKSNPNVKSTRVELSKKAKKFEDKTNHKLSYYRVWISGIFYRAREEEKIGIEPSFEAITAQLMEGKTYKLDSGRNTLAAKHRQLTREYEEDYDKWKLAWE